MKIFGERLKELRTGKRITQKQLAAVVNVSGNTIYAWENDKQEPSLTALVQLCDYFEVTADYLLGKADY